MQPSGDVRDQINLATEGLHLIVRGGHLSRGRLLFPKLSQQSKRLLNVVNNLSINWEVKGHMISLKKHMGQH
jgi:hypothetical protein